MSGDPFFQKKYFYIIVFFAFWLPTAYAQNSCGDLPFIRGLRIYGGSDETNLPIVLSGVSPDSTAFPYITIRFDVAEKTPPRLKIKFYHCDKDWNVDDNFFVRDDFFSYTRILFYDQAPTGALHYTWRFTNRFPSKEHPFVRFLFSGNWIFDIVDEFDDTRLYATGRFIVVENIVRTNLAVLNDYWTDYNPPFDRVHHLRLKMNVPENIFTDYVQTVDFYKNQNLFEPYRVSILDFKPNTRVEGIGLKEKVFSYLNILPGNGYRFYDIRNETMYPTRKIVVKQGGPDFTRFRFGTEEQHYFGSAVTAVPRSWDADYMCARFELAHPVISGRDVFVAGIFNQWDPQEEDRMIRDEKTGNYVVDRWLYRGAYDYQYVIGNYDPDLGYVVNKDWTYVEGNAWETRNEYWAIVYYDDDQYGGVTRAVGIAITRGR